MNGIVSKRNDAKRTNGLERITRRSIRFEDGTRGAVWASFVSFVGRILCVDDLVQGILCAAPKKNLSCGYNIVVVHVR